MGFLNKFSGKFGNTTVNKKSSEISSLSVFEFVLVKGKTKRFNKSRYVRCVRVALCGGGMV